MKALTAILYTPFYKKRNRIFSNIFNALLLFITFYNNFVDI
jgi:hypothetical protein